MTKNFNEMPFWEFLPDWEWSYLKNKENFDAFTGKLSGLQRARVYKYLPRAVRDSILEMGRDGVMYRGEAFIGGLDDMTEGLAPVALLYFLERVLIPPYTGYPLDNAEYTCIPFAEIENLFYFEGEKIDDVAKILNALRGVHFQWKEHIDEFFDDDFCDWEENAEERNAEERNAEGIEARKNFIFKNQTAD